MNSESMWDRLISSFEQDYPGSPKMLSDFRAAQTTDSGNLPPDANDMSHAEFCDLMDSMVPTPERGIRKQRSPSPRRRNDHRPLISNKHPSPLTEEDYRKIEETLDLFDRLIGPIFKTLWLKKPLPKMMPIHDATLWAKHWGNRTVFDPPRGKAPPYPWMDGYCRDCGHEFRVHPIDGTSYSKDLNDWRCPQCQIR